MAGASVRPRLDTAGVSFSFPDFDFTDFDFLGFRQEGSRGWAWLGQAQCLASTWLNRHIQFVYDNITQVMG